MNRCKNRLVIALLILAGFTVKGQDTLYSANKAPQRRHELGVSIIVPLIIAIGATDNNERYTNITYRYFLSKKQTIKPFIGISTISNNPTDRKSVSSTNTSTIYAMNIKSTPSNFQIGVGYEYILGNKKLKHVIGADLYYNNKFEKESHSYSREFDSTDVNGRTSRKYTVLDTGKYVQSKNYNKIGFNLSYTLRYEVSKRWVISASTIMTNKFYRQKSTSGYSNDYEMNVVGLVSDISIFYRF